ncbi:copper homeostasis protein CutC [Arcicella lustrica]|uniref:PF03932 family protein CutC n=1 Tax=Arcicella lustrica TaxID=2984196 RepID=A0ABU5SJ22_9BACT|nr:copper homeostasis protein CutC [Arcicella sp. DC25W]MEA5427245.1 copper homeostasis protein CutC [Arcicella sp. DC25W]
MKSPNLTLSKKPLVEVCAYSFESCIAAEKAQANRIELCSSMFEGGTTPSAGLVKMVTQKVNIEVHAMIRPRGGDFCYSNEEIEVMKADILSMKTLGCAGIVLGILQTDGKVNIQQTAELVKLAAPLQVTFHRAIDMTPNYAEALEAIIEAGCTRVLTSGQKNIAIDGIEEIANLVKQANGRIQIMVGSGVNLNNALTIAQTGVDAIHLTGKSTKDSAMIYRKEGIAMGGLPAVPEYEIAYSDSKKIQAVVQLLAQAYQPNE